MKVSTRILLIAALTIGSAFSVSAQPFTKGGYTPVKSKEQAEKLPADSQVMMACSGCQTIQVVKKGGILDLFTPDTKHECPGCSGKLTYVGAPGKSGGTKYTHTCTKCGDSAAYVCADHH